MLGANRPRAGQASSRRLTWLVVGATQRAESDCQAVSDQE